MESIKKYILWLPGWYPNLIEPFAGDFIQRHAQAVSLYSEVVVIHVIRDIEGKITRRQKEVRNVVGRLTEITIYYYVPPIGIKALDKAKSLIRHNSIARERIKELLTQKGFPDLSHVHVVNKNAWVARWLQRKYSIAFVCSEQWTIYLQEAKPNFSSLPAVEKHSIKRLLKQALGISVVSDYLGQAIKKIVSSVNYEVIPNLVDPKKFYPEINIRKDPVKFIHISNLNYQKNFEDIALACSMIKTNKQNFVLDVYGPHTPYHLDYCEKLGISQLIKFHGEIEHQQLSVMLRKSDALILYSRYETFGCVYIEAMASGVPVISSDIPVAHEIIRENFSGYFTEGENPEKLAEKMEWFINQTVGPDKKALAENAASLYSPEFIGRRFINWYNACLQAVPGNDYSH